MSFGSLSGVYLECISYLTIRGSRPQGYLTLWSIVFPLHTKYRRYQSQSQAQNRNTCILSTERRTTLKMRRITLRGNDHTSTTSERIERPRCSGFEGQFG